MPSQPIISVSGLRAIVGDSLTQELIERYISAYALQLNERDAQGPIVLSRDGRASGEMICEWVANTLIKFGRHVLYADIMATPTVGIQILEQRAAGAVQVTASHNPPEYNGLKLYGPDGRILNADQGAQLLELYRQGAAPTEPSQTATKTELNDTHLLHLQELLDLVDVEAIRKSQFKVLLDCNHGSGSILAIPLLESLGCQLTVLGAEPNGQFAHPAEPTADNLESVGREVIGSQCDIGFCQDPDADRLALIDANGQYPGEEYTLALCLKQLLADQPGNVVINCATSRMAYDLAEAAGQQCYESAVGEAHVVDLMLSCGASFGGEGNGGPIDPRVGLIRDSFVGMVRVLALMASQQRPLHEIAQDIPAYAIYKDKIPLEGADPQAVCEELVRRFPEAEADWTDGLKLRWPNGDWLLARASNTEPILRAIAETRSIESSRALCEKALGQ